MNAFEFENLYEKYSIDINNMTCVMLKTQDIPVDTLLDERKLFFADKEHLPFVQGAVASNNSHITLHQSLLPCVTDEDIDLVLDGCEPAGFVTINSIETFTGQEYSTIVAKVNVDDWILEAHTRLSFLPHVDLFEDFIPHITLAYVVPGYVDEAVERLSFLVGQTKTTAARMSPYL